MHQEGCSAVPFTPTINVEPGTKEVDSPLRRPSRPKFRLKIQKKAAAKSLKSQLRNAKVTLPAGMGLNPSASNGLVACKDEQFNKNKRIENNSCPEKSIIGSAEIETPPLPKGSLKGNIYVGEQKSSDPTSGEEFRDLVEAKSKEYGIVVRLIGEVSANPTTGQLTAKFNEQEVGPLAGPLPEGLPQVPFESVKLSFNGVKKVLTSPPTCAAAETTSTMEPWSSSASTKTPTAKFTLSSLPGGGSCPTDPRLCAPSPRATTAISESTKAGAYSPFKVTIGRPDGQQELKRVNVTLPKGLTGNLAAIPYCSEAALAAAAASTGTAQQAATRAVRVKACSAPRRPWLAPGRTGLLSRQGLPRRSL